MKKYFTRVGISDILLKVSGDIAINIQPDIIAGDWRDE